MLTLAAASPTLGQEPPLPVEPQPQPAPAPRRPHPRELNGHTFIPSTIAADPFTATWFGSQTGFGFVNATLVQRDAQGAPTGGTRSLSLVPFTQSFGLQIGVVPQYFALRVSATGGVIAPVNAEGAIDYGALIGYDVAGGATLSFRLGRFFRLGAAVDVDYSSSFAFNIGDALARSLNAGKVDASTLLVNTSTVEVLGTVAAALSPHKVMGLTLAGQYAHDFSSAQGMASNGGAIGFSAALDLDFKAVSPVPLGIIGAYRMAAPTDHLSQVTHVVGGGLYYTGRRSLALGPEVQVRIPPATPDVSLLYVYGVITLRYYW